MRDRLWISKDSCDPGANNEKEPDSMKKVMLLAAGRGERLRPLTDSIPKPLIDVGGRPLIAHHLTRLAAAGFSDVVINLGWLGEQIPATLGDGEQFGLRIRYSKEPPGALETAGGIHHALPLLGNDPFIVISADVITDFPFGELAKRPVPAGAHLVLIDNPPHHPEGDFVLDQGKVAVDGREKLTFSGFALFRPELFARLEPGWRPLRPVLESAIAAGEVSGEHYRGRWLDTGTPERLEVARQSPLVDG